MPQLPKGLLRSVASKTAATRSTSTTTTTAGSNYHRLLRGPPTALLLCDVQERFRPLIHAFPAVVHTAGKMLAASRILDLPCYVTEQHPKALGKTVAELDISGVAWHAAKTRFSMCSPELLQHLQDRALSHVVLCGIEAHVCVTQTTLDLLQVPGMRVSVLADGISSMNPGEVPIALQRLRQEGAIITTSDSLLFELLADATHPKFREISRLVKEHMEGTATAVAALPPRSC